MWKDSDQDGDQLVRGSFVLVVGKFAMKAAQFARTVVIARLLFPEDIGLFALAALSLGFVELFVQGGFYQAIVQERDDVRKYLDTAWVGQIARNIIVGGIVIVAAPLLGAFFGHPDIVPLTRVLALSVVLIGFQNIGIILLQKEMRFNRQFFFDITVVLCDVASVIVAGFILRNAWALVIGALVNRIAALFFSFVFHPYRPKFAPQWDAFRHLFGYGKWVSLGAIATYFVGQGDKFAVGKIVGPAGLGFYQPAFALALLPVAEFGRTLGNALFPLFAKIASGKREDSFFRVTEIVFAFTIPASIGIFALAPDIVRIVYGERWLPMVPLVSALALYGLLRTFETVGAPFFNGIGKPKVVTTAFFAQLLAMAFLLVPLLRAHGLVGAAWAMLGSGAASMLLYVAALRHEKVLTLARAARLLLPPLLAGAGMFAAISALESVLPVANILILLVFVGFGAVVYGVFLWCIDRASGGGIFTDVRWIRARMFPQARK